MVMQIALQRRRKMWLRAMPEIALAVVAFLMVVALAPMSAGLAFPAPPPPELVSLSHTGLGPALGVCQSAWLSFAAMTDAAPSYFYASLGPNFGGIDALDRSVWYALAVAVAGMVAVNMAFLRHLRTVLASVR